MAFGRNSRGISELQKKKSQQKSAVTEANIKKLQKTLKDKLSKQIKNVTANYNEFLSKDTKARANLEKAYESTKKLQERVMDRLIKAVDDKRKEIFNLNQKNDKKMYLGEIEAKLDEMKDFTSEIKPTIKAIHKKYKNNVIPRLDELRDQIKTQIIERNKNTKTVFGQINQSLRKFRENPAQASTNDYKKLNEMIENFPEYAEVIKQSYNQGNIYITMNLARFTNSESVRTTYNQKSSLNSNSPTERDIKSACTEATEAIREIGSNMKTLQQNAANSPTTPNFLAEYLNKIKDPLLKMTFIFGAERALIIRTTQYMNDMQRELKEYEQTASKLHTTTKDLAKRIGIGFLRLVPAIIGVATGLGSTLGVLTDLIESLGWFLNAVAYGVSDATGVITGEQKTELRTIISNIDDISKTMFDSAGISAEKNPNDNA